MELAETGAQAIQDGFVNYRVRFKDITGRAKRRFEQRDWHGMHADAVDRLTLYQLVVEDVAARVRQELGERANHKPTWQRMKGEYANWIPNRDDFELAETFFNSISRRILNTVGVNSNIEFLEGDFDAPQLLDQQHGFCRRFAYEDTLTDLVRDILRFYHFDAWYLDFEWDVQGVVREIERAAQNRLGTTEFDAIEMLEPVFYRGQGAYLLGQVRKDTLYGGRFFPLVLALRHPEGGLVVDAVLTSDHQISILFSFAQAYFHILAEQPGALVRYLKQLMPWKRLADLYTAIGFNKHGKTEFYRDLMHHLDHSQDQFEVARGEWGTVMEVFTLSSYDVVFKLIKDKPGNPKVPSRAEVIEKYDQVFLHNRAGRLVDAQAFERLSFEKARFVPELLQKLLETAPSTVEVMGDRVLIQHAYVERRVVPLDVYLREASHAQGLDAALEYGQAIKDLAALNLYPGDVWLNNFGVTRHGRVVFYDYAELSEVTAQPADFFPKQCCQSLGLAGELRRAFEQAHGDLLEAQFWQAMQQRHRAEEMIDILPYRPDERLGQN